MTWLRCPHGHTDTKGVTVRVGQHRSAPALAALADDRCPACPDHPLTPAQVVLYGQDRPAGDCPCCGARWLLDSPDGWDCLAVGSLEPDSPRPPGKGARARDRAQHKPDRYRILAEYLADGAPVRPADIRAGLVEASNRLAAARDAERAALDDISAWLRAASDRVGRDGLTLSEAIRLAGISRRTAYQMLGDDQVSAAPSAQTHRKAPPLDPVDQTGERGRLGRPGG